MRKNKAMRLASGLLVAVMLTTCIISGTFAKYVTTNNASDTARVAKWGVTITANSALFEGAYNAHGDGTAATADRAVNWTQVSPSATSITVNSEAKSGSDPAVADSDLVAPGTKSSENGLQFSIKGTPEVATTITFDFSGTNKDVFLAAGTYADRTSGDKLYDVFEVGEGGYYPVQFTLSGNASSTSTADWKVLKTGTLKEVETYLTEAFTKANGATANTVFNANTDLAKVIVKDVSNNDVTLNGEYKITWEWAFNDELANNQKDTLLGDLAADSTGVWMIDSTKTHTGVGHEHTADCFKQLTANTDYCNTVAFSMVITVAQVD